MRVSRDPFRGHSSGTAVLFGGSFDPPTCAHEQLPAIAAHRAGAHTLIYIPAARSPFKPNPPEASNNHRLAMLEALEPSTHADITAVTCPIELERFDHAGRPSFTIDTLIELRVQAPPRLELRLLIGEDQARSRIVAGTLGSGSRPKRIAS